MTADAIRHRSDPPLATAEYLKQLKDRAGLFKILRNADVTDATGAVGLMRAFTSKSFLPEYDPGDIKGPGAVYRYCCHADAHSKVIFTIRLPHSMLTVHFFLFQCFPPR